MNLYILKCTREKPDKRTMQILTHCAESTYFYLVDTLLDCRFKISDVDLIEYRQNMSRGIPSYLLGATEIHMHCDTVISVYKEVTDEQKA
jgi:hypothetical protein